MNSGSDIIRANFNSCKTVYILGASDSGIKISNFCYLKHKKIFISDLSAYQKKIFFNQIKQSTKISKSSFSEHPKNFVSESCMIIYSSSIPINDPVLDFARKSKKFICTATEFAAAFISGNLFIITGTNGKSTSLQVIDKFIDQSKNKIFITDRNSRKTIIDVLDSEGEYDAVIAELSADELNGASMLTPKIVMITNLIADEGHVEQFGGHKKYLLAKLKWLDFIDSDFELISKNNAINHINTVLDGNFFQKCCKKIIIEEHKKQDSFLLTFLGAMSNYCIMKSELNQENIYSELRKIVFKQIKQIKLSSGVKIYIDDNAKNLEATLWTLGIIDFQHILVTLNENIIKHIPNNYVTKKEFVVISSEFDLSSRYNECLLDVLEKCKIHRVDNIVISLGVATLSKFDHIKRLEEIINS